MLEIYSNPVAIEPLMPIAERGRLADGGAEKAETLKS